MGARASGPLANPTPVNTGILSKAFHLWKGQNLYRLPQTVYNPGRRVLNALVKDQWIRRTYPWSVEAHRGMMMDDTKWSPFRTDRWFRRHKDAGPLKGHRRRLLTDYKKALQWMSPEYWEGWLARRVRSSDMLQKGIRFPPEVVDHWHKTGYYYKMESWPLQFEAHRRRHEWHEYQRGEYRDVWGNREFPLPVDPATPAWYNNPPTKPIV